MKTKRKVPPTYSRADENARSLDGGRDDEGCYVAQAAYATGYRTRDYHIRTSVDFSAQSTPETADTPKD